MDVEFRNALSEGTVLDNYRIESVLGEGGFGVTYLVTELNLGKEYAIKELIPDGVAIRKGGATVMARNSLMEEDFETTRRHFIKEARVLDTLKHPAIVAVHKLLEANGTCYMVMDYVEGETLGAYLKKQGGRLASRAEFESIFYPIMDGLELLHGKDMIHRDIKPENIMVTPDGSPVLLDFGASCRVQNHTVAVTQFNSAGYSAFEQYTTMRTKQGAYTDIYALGATMVRAITGTKPDDAADRMEEDFYQSLAEQEELVTDYGEDLLLAIDAALLLKKGERPQTIEEWREIIGEEDFEEDIETQFELGLKYYHGSGVEKDWQEAVRWFRKAGDQGDATAQLNLGLMYERGEGVKKDHEEAVSWYRMAADHGDPIAQRILGVKYANGKGVEEDDEEAVKLYRKAADQGDAKAQRILGNRYSHATGVEQDDEEAVKWYRRAADQGDAIAQFNLGVFYTNGRSVRKDYKEAVKWCRKAANQGHASAQCELGIRYGSGLGVEKDDKEAVKWYRKAADQGYAQAQNNLGLRYGNGEGVKKDDEEAVKWYRKAADQGYAQAQTNLALRYWDGEGVKKDNEEAVKWYRKAADQGYAQAQNNLGVRYRNGEGVKKDDEEAVNWYRKAADQGDAIAQYNLGVMYESGKGLEKDDEEALKWYRKAADQGYAEAQYELGLRYESGKGVSEDYEKALDLYRKAADQGHEEANNLTNEFSLFTLFSWEGRLGIKGFWISQIVMLFFFVGLLLVGNDADIRNLTSDRHFAGKLGIILIFSVPIYVRRLRDLGEKVVLVIPMFFGGYYLVMLFSRQGVQGGDKELFAWIFCSLFFILFYGRLLFSKKSPK